MTGERALAALLARYGQPVALYDAGGQELARGRAFLQPILERGEEGQCRTDC